jgi:hypothetical protein
MGNLEKGKRVTEPTSITPEEMREYLAELKRRPGTPLPCLQEDAAAVQGILDLLIVKGVLKEENGESPDQQIVRYADRYNSLVTGTIMLLIEKGIITEKEMEASLLAFHHAIRHFGNRTTSFEEVATLRRETLRKQIGR